jgi:low temperature requirement protein LtrA
MRGLTVPDRDDDFSADPVELFFDLAFVFAFSQIVSVLVHDPTMAGVAEAGLLFLMLWLPWTQLTWAANAVPGNSRTVRLIILVATVASVPMAAAVTTAVHGDGGPVFAIALAVIILMGLSMMILGLERGTEEFRSIVRYAFPNVVALAVLVTGAFFDTWRVAAWVLGIVIVLVGTIAAGAGQWIIRSGHFAERHGLIVIVALGEVIVAIGLPVLDDLQEGRGIPGRTVLALVAAGSFGALLWWGYFDRPQRALEHRAETMHDVDRGRFARDVYTYLHAPIVAGIVLAAAALEEIALHPTDPVPRAFRAMLLGGLVLHLGGVAGAVARSFHVVARERIVAAVVIAGVLAAARNVDGVVVLLAIDAILAGMLLVEHLRIEGPVRPPSIEALPLDPLESSD